MEHPSTSVLQSYHSSLHEGKADQGEGRGSSKLLGEHSRELFLGCSSILVVGEHTADSPSFSLSQRYTLVQFIL
jgi:hypothetical protein